MNCLKKFNPDFSKILLIDKPKDLTTFDLIRHIKKHFYEQGYTRKSMPKIGHTGTLDPFATGLVIILLGKATKHSERLMNQKKTYQAKLLFGKKTNTADLTGDFVEEKPLPFEVKKEWEKFIHFFCEQDYFQTPPMFSAKKINGKKLYELARQGIEVPREKKLKKIYSLTYLEETKDQNSGHTLQLSFEAETQSGTYIRTLGEDLAEQLGSTGHLIELRRIKSGDYLVKNAHSLEDLSRQLREL